MLSFEKTYAKRRLGCVRVVARLFILRHLDLPYIMSMCDSLLAAENDHAFECLKELLALIGSQLATIVRDDDRTDWWTSFFEDLMKLASSEGVSPSSKALIRDIILMKVCMKDFISGILLNLNDFAVILA